jgi:hypothetical protein
MKREGHEIDGSYFIWSNLDIWTRGESMFICENPDLVPIRSVFLESIEKLIPGISNKFPNALQTFKGFLAQREITPLLGKLVFDVLKFFDATPMLIVNSRGDITLREGGRVVVHLIDRHTLFFSRFTAHLFFAAHTHV